VKKRVAIGVGILVFLAVVAVAASFIIGNIRAEKEGNRAREEIKASFFAQLDTYNQAFSLSSASPYKGSEYCVILTESVRAKVEYKNKSVGDDALEEKLKEFARQTGIDVIYANGNCVYYKIFFESNRNERSEANFIRFFTEPADTTGLTPLADGWYYSEQIIG